MNILMMTNTYLPHVGGVARSVGAFTQQLRNLGHRVVVVSPEFERDKKEKRQEQDVIRIPAIQRFNGSDFSVVLPIPGFLDSRLEDFNPDIVHAHHPFLIGSTAVRVSTKYRCPLVYTQHTMFEKYTHYVPVDVPRLKKFVVKLSTGYANMSDRVIAPSESVARILEERGVRTPVDIIPTGIRPEDFTHGHGWAVRNSNGIGDDAFVVGHVGRLAPEKNLEFLAEATALFLKEQPRAHFLVVGYGPSAEQIKDIFTAHNVRDRLHLPGKLQGKELTDAYNAMDIFAFSSKSETQGLVLAEAMAAGLPVVALDASGVREVVKDGRNGYLLTEQQQDAFAQAIKKLCGLSPAERDNFVREAKKTARDFSMDNCTKKLIRLYEKVLEEQPAGDVRDESPWRKSVEQIKTEWELLSNFTTAFGNTIHRKENQPD